MTSTEILTPTDSIPTMTPTRVLTATQTASSPSQTPTDPTTGTENELSADAIAGITVGVVVFVAACIALALLVAIIFVARDVVYKPKKQETEKGRQVWTNTATGGEETEMTPSQTTD